MSVLVRRATGEECAEVGELTALTYLGDGLVPEGSDYQVSLRRADDRAEHCELLVAVEAGRLLGTVTFVRPGTPYCEVALDGEAEFRMLAVRPSARGRGVGRLLVQACLDRAGDQLAARVVISTAEPMLAAQRLYTSLGFVRLAERDWWPVPTVRLLAYALELPDR